MVLQRQRWTGNKAPLRIITMVLEFKPPGDDQKCGEAEHSTKRHRTGRVIKDLRLITTDTSNVVMVDDKPSFVQHGRVIYFRCLSRLSSGTLKR